MKTPQQLLQQTPTRDPRSRPGIRYRKVHKIR